MAQAYTPPTDYKSGLEEVLSEAGKIYQQQKAAGYQTYQGPQIAGFAPEEQAAMRGIAGLVGTGQQYFNPATALQMGAARQFTPTEAATYMSPYQQAVVDVEKREASRYFPQQMQQIGAQAAGAGGYGGSRQAILEAETLRNQAQMLGDIQTRGSQRAFEDAQKAFEQQLGRERGTASALMQLGQTVPQQRMTELTALAGVGEAQRGMTQAGLDLAKQQYERQLNFPYEALGQYQSTLYQMPLEGFRRYQPVAKPSSSQNLASILGSAASIGKGFGLFSEGGHVAFRSQGGLSGMVNKLAAGSSVGSDMQEEETKEITNSNVKSALFDSLMKLQTGISDYDTQMKETLKEQQRIAEERKAELEKQSGPSDYIIDMLLGYGSADPEAGMAGQLAQATMYADQQRDETNEELRQIENDLATGKLTQAEAGLKMQQLQISTLADLEKAVKQAGIPGEDYTRISKSVTDTMGLNATADPLRAIQITQKALQAYLLSNGDYNVVNQVIASEMATEKDGNTLRNNRGVVEGTEVTPNEDTLSNIEIPTQSDLLN